MSIHSHLKCRVNYKSPLEKTQGAYIRPITPQWRLISKVEVTHNDCIFPKFLEQVYMKSSDFLDQFIRVIWHNL